MWKVSSFQVFSLTWKFRTKTPFKWIDPWPKVYIVFSKKKRSSELMRILWCKPHVKPFFFLLPFCKKCCRAERLIEGTRLKGWLTQITKTFLYSPLAASGHAESFDSMRLCLWDICCHLNTVEIKRNLVCDCSQPWKWQNIQHQLHLG